MKAKPTARTKNPVLSRLTQKTFIAVIALYFVSSLVMLGQYYFSIYQAKSQVATSLDSILLPLIPVATPLIIFVVAYTMNREKATRLWRVSQSLIIALMVMIFEAFAAMANIYLFSSPLGYNSAPAVPYSSLIELIPVVLSVAVAVALSIVLAKTKDRNTNDASALLQKLFLGFVVLFGLGQPILSLVPYSSSQPALDQGALIGTGISIAVVAVVVGVLYLLVSRQRTVRERLFVAMFYVTFGVFISIALSTLLYAFISPSVAYDGSGFISYLPMIATIVGFVAIIVWHKIKKVL